MQPVDSQPSARPDYDQALKRLLLRAHDAFLALIAPDLSWIGERSVELPAVARRADLVWEVVGDEQAGGQRGLLHVELQTKVEEDIGERIAEYALRLWRRDHLPVESVVVFLRPATATPASRFVLPGLRAIRRERLVDTYSVVRLWEIPQEQVLATGEYALWPLAALMAGATVETTLGVAERIAAAPAPLEERRELTGLLVTLAGLRQPLGELFAAVRRNPMIDELLRESSVAEEFIREGMERGREEGMERGREEGMERGREEGMERGRDQGVRKSVRLVLQGRFQAFDADLLAAIERADEATLEQVLLHAATDTREQVRARLGLK